MLQDLINNLATEITDLEGRERARRYDDQEKFLYSIKYLIKELYRASRSIPSQYCPINKNKNWYSINNNYSDKMLGYQTTMLVYENMIKLGYIKEVSKGWNGLNPSLTRFKGLPKLNRKLREMRNELEVSLVPDLNANAVIMKNKVEMENRDPKTKERNPTIIVSRRVPYEATDDTDTFNKSLRIINKTLLSSWVDLRLPDSEFKKLRQRMATSTVERERYIDFSNRTLRRSFSNNNWTSGGRYYGSWWLLIPNKDFPYRSHITIDYKPTTEHDYSRMHPNMLYAREGVKLSLSNADPYHRILETEEQNIADKPKVAIAKAMFNAMLNSEKPLKRYPREIQRDVTALKKKTGFYIQCGDLMKKITDSHSQIAKYFGTGIGLKLQYHDSLIAELVMLEFAKKRIPILPVHDSFICHHGYGDEVRQAMIKAYSMIVGSDVTVKSTKIARELMNVSELKPIPDNELIGQEEENVTVGSLLRYMDDYKSYEERWELWQQNKTSILKKIANEKIS